MLEQLSNEGRLVFSTQVFDGSLGDDAAESKKTSHSGRLELTLRRLAAASDVLPITAPQTFRALLAMPRHGLAFWDALIWAAAAENGVGTIYAEDFQDGRNIEGVRFVIPFLGTAPGVT